MPTQERYHALDAARAIALLLGITLHAACSFMPGYTRWVIIDSQAGPAPTVIAFVIHAFRMPLFFMMAGFFARLVCVRKGAGHFMRDRLRRILIPLVAGWFVLYPFIVWAWIWGGQRSGADWVTPEMAAVPAWKAAVGAFVLGYAFGENFSLTHLWFLYYLLMIYAVVLALRRLVPCPERCDRTFRIALVRRWGMLVLVVPLAIVLRLGGFDNGIPNPERLTPEPATLAAYGLFFAAGWMIHRQPDLLRILEDRWRSHTAFGLATAAIIQLARVPAVARWLGAVPRPVSAFVYALAMWTLLAGFAGACLRFLSTPSPTIRYLSDSSYWLYLIHLPAIAFLQVAIAPWPVHWVLKIAALHLAVLPPLLLSYQFLVRQTWVGAMLNGRRRGRRFEPAVLPGV